MKRMKSEKANKPKHSSALHEFRLLVQPSVMLLCKVLGISPEQLVGDFLNVLACSSWKREGRDRLRVMVIEYILEFKYGQEYFLPDDIREMFNELNALGLLYPKDGKATTIDEFVNYRKSYYEYWVDKWLNKYRRSLKVS